VSAPAAPPAGGPREQRVLLKALTARDAQMTCALLTRAGIDCDSFAGLDELVAEIPRGAGAVVVAEEALAGPASAAFRTCLEQQPPWSDLPVVVLARPGANSPLVAQAMDLHANITVIERPLRVSALVSTLRSALRGRNRQYQLRAVLEGLEQADQRKTEFLATLAHELRNPLAPLSTALDILGGHAVDEATSRTYFEMMRRQVALMRRLIDDLMQVSRITRGKIELQRETVALDRVLAGAIETGLPQIEARGQQLEVSIPEHRWYVDGDAVRLTQIFANLINNASKYTPPGGRIEVDLTRDGNEAVVRVSDNGYGIPADRIDDIFGMFVQVSGSSRASQGGLGIGLTLADSLVRLHGGRIRAHSAGLDRGSTFTVRLPLLDHVRTLPHKPPPAQARTRLRGTILVVDDNRDAADALAFLLRSMGATTHVAYDGPEALAAASDNTPDVAILDIGMPGMDGCDLAQRLRAEPRHAGLQLIALTGWGQVGDRQRILQAGFDHHLLKPLNLSNLISLLGPAARP
jgi:signal transduction histidine kinase/CheY-like chemotaxis protein